MSHSTTFGFPLSSFTNRRIVQVKETAIKNGIGLPKPKRQAIPNTASAKLPNVKTLKPIRNAKTTPAVKRPVTKAPSKLTTLKPPGEQAKAQKDQYFGDTKEVVTGSGVKIKIPSRRVEEAQKTGTIVTTNGHIIRVDRKEIEEAQKKTDTTVLTSSGVQLKVTPSGKMITQQPSKTASPQLSNNTGSGAKYVFKPTAKSSMDNTHKSTGAKTVPKKSSATNTPIKAGSGSQTKDQGKKQAIKTPIH
jgi:hypothetical protein